MNGKAASWVAGAVVLSLILIAGAWFGLISPKLEETAEIVAQTEIVEENNQLLFLKNQRLKADFEKLDQYRERIAEVAVRLPHDVGISELARTFEKVASDHELTIINIAPSTPVEVPSTKGEEPAGSKPKPAASKDTDDVEDGDGEESPEHTPTTLEEWDAALRPSLPELQVSGLYAIPVSATLVGDPSDVRELIDDLQNKIERAYLVTSFSFLTQDEADASQGRPDLEAGDVEVVLTGYVYVLLDDARMGELVEELLGDVTPVDPDALPRSNRNPFPKLNVGSSSGSEES